MLLNDHRVKVKNHDMNQSRWFFSIDLGASVVFLFEWGLYRKGALTMHGSEISWTKDWPL